MTYRNSESHRDGSEPLRDIARAGLRTFPVRLVRGVDADDARRLLASLDTIGHGILPIGTQVEIVGPTMR